MILKTLFLAWTFFVATFSSALPIYAGKGLKDTFDRLAGPLLERNYAVGVVVAVIDANQTQVFSYGTKSKDSREAPDANTVFDIGSITKTFTGLLLQDLAVRGRIRLDDPVQEFLPGSVRVPKKGGRPISLVDLATHTSGLPRVPTNFNTKDLNDPYSDYTVEKLYRFLSTYQLPRAPGDEFEYSNLGFGLLGHVLSLHENRPFETLVIDRICRPLGLLDTGIGLSQNQRGRLTPGHDLEGNGVPEWHFLVLAGCGALRSTANDMVTYLKANMGLIQTPLSSAMSATHVPRHGSAIPRWKIGIGWFVNPTGDIGWHDGGTGGYYSFVGFNKKRKFGLVWLSNSRLWRIAFLRERLEEVLLGKEVRPLNLKRPIALTPPILKSYVGEYQIRPGVVMAVSFVDGYLGLGKPGRLPTSILYPESKTRFFFLETDRVTLSFERDKEGRVTGLILHEEGVRTPAEKIK